MSISLIVNTCAARDDGTLSNAKQPHAQRAYALQNFILPAYIEEAGIDEVIVVGEWYEGEGYTYVPFMPYHETWADTLDQRQIGFEMSKGDILIFQHDDHFLDLASLNDVMPMMPADVLSPARYTRLRNVAGERLNDGSRDGYINGHCAIYRREVIEACPWNELPEKFIWDVLHTEQIRKAGFKISWTDTIKVWDVEMGAKPWE